MLLTLEALQARHGDCLLLHYGAEDQPRVALIDGGPGGVFAGELHHRLIELRSERVAAGLLESSALLPLELVMCSHIDEDHIQGLLSLVRRIRDRRAKGQDQEWRIGTLWLNAFEDLVGDRAPSASSANTSGVAMAAAVVASVPQGQKLRDLARGLTIPSNAPFKGLVQAAAAGQKPKRVVMSGGLTLTVLGPDEARLKKLQEDWRTYKPTAMSLGVSPAAYLDDSIYNLSSLVILAEAKTKTAARRILLTGDALGKDVVQWLTDAGLLNADGQLELDVLKVPHHGSSRNVTVEFFQTLPARHYVISGDGNHGNPKPETLQMIADARGGDPYTLHLTYADGKNELGDKLGAYFESRRQAGRPVDVRFGAARKPLRLVLGGPED